MGFQLKIRLPYYRGVFLSQIKGSMVVDGETLHQEQILWRVGGKSIPSRRCGRTGTPIGTALEPAS